MVQPTQETVQPLLDVGITNLIFPFSAPTAVETIYRCIVDHLWAPQTSFDMVDMSKEEYATATIVDFYFSLPIMSLLYIFVLAVGTSRDRYQSPTPAEVNINKR